MLLESGARSSILGYNGSELLSYVSRAMGSGDHKTLLQEVEPATPTATTVYGRTDIITAIPDSYCDGALGTTCTLDGTMNQSVQTDATWDATGSQWMVAYRGLNQVTTIPQGGGTVNLFETTNNNINNFTFRRDGGNQYIYYCATNGKLYKRDVINDIENELTIPSSNIKCAGHSMRYHSGRDSVIFIYEENGLYGIAEYKNP